MSKVQLTAKWGMNIVTRSFLEHMTPRHPHQSLSAKVSPVELHETLEERINVARIEDEVEDSSVDRHG